MEVLRPSQSAGGASSAKEERHPEVLGRSHFDYDPRLFSMKAVQGRYCYEYFTKFLKHRYHVLWCTVEVCSVAVWFYSACRILRLAWHGSCLIVLSLVYCHQFQKIKIQRT